MVLSDFKEVIDEQGTWLVNVKGTIKLLKEPSEIYLTELKIEHEKQKEIDLMNSLIPSLEDLTRAETELQIIELLLEVGLI